MTILAIFISLILLMILHEFGHFILAKKVGIKVEEFGIGYPPRLIGKRFGETIYSLNLLPLGSFVRLYGEEGKENGSRSFTSKKIWQRALVVLGGVTAFWIIAAVLLAIVAGLGVSKAIPDEATGFSQPKVQIVEVEKGSPAQQAGIEMGDVVLNVRNFSGKEQKKITKVSELQKFTNSHKGQVIILKIQHGKKISDMPLSPRISPPEGEGSMGVGLIRVVSIKYPWYRAILEGIRECIEITWMIIVALANVLLTLFKGKPLPSGVQLMSVVGIGSLMAQVFSLGISYYLRFLAVISINLAILNILPIPALDGGKLLFLVIEAIRGKPVPQKIEQRVTSLFFILLVVVAILVTAKDVIKLL